jgi:hypothetical protein
MTSCCSQIGLAYFHRHRSERAGVISVSQRIAVVVVANRCVERTVRSARSRLVGSQSRSMIDDVLGKV